MSRVILSRHANGEEKVVLGYDRPMSTYFAHEYDDDEQCIKAAEPGYHHRGILSTDALAFEAGLAGITIEWTVELRNLLASQVDLDYPESNVVVDLSGDQLIG